MDPLGSSVSSATANSERVGRDCEYTSGVPRCSETRRRQSRLDGVTSQNERSQVFSRSRTEIRSRRETHFMARSFSRRPGLSAPGSGMPMPEPGRTRFADATGPPPLWAGVPIRNTGCGLTNLEWLRIGDDTACADAHLALVLARDLEPGGVGSHGTRELSAVGLVVAVLE